MKRCGITKPCKPQNKDQQQVHKDIYIHSRAYMREQIAPVGHTVASSFVSIITPN